VQEDAPVKTLLFLAALLVAAPARALCTVTALPVAFGVYNSIGSQHADGAGRVDIACLPATPYTVTLTSGAGSFASRRLTSGPNRLAYNLFADPARSAVWGDGSGGSSIVGGNGLNASHTVYGRIPGGQNVPVGAYADTITVIVGF
jgi:spore coat protein U-like protein